MDKIQIEIPKAPERDIVYIPKGDLGDIAKNINNRFEKLDNLMIGIVASVVISGIGVVIATLGLFIDQMRYNNAAYKDYSNKINNVDSLISENESFREEIIDQQKMIADEQNQIDSLQKK